jgi:hypothetical protein
VKLRNILIAIPILIAAAFAGLKGYLHYAYESLLDEAIQNASPFVELRYDDLATTLDGDLIIKGITVTPRAEFTDTVRIGSVHYDTPGLLYLLTNRDRLEQGEFPSHVRLEIRGLEVPLDGFIVGALDKNTEAENAKLDGQITPFCGDAHYLTSRHYAEMGYEDLVSDISLGYEFNKHSQLVHITLTWAQRGIGSLEFSADLSGVSSTSAQTLMASGPPTLSRVDLVYWDNSAVSRILEYCAAKRQMSREELIQAEVNAEPDYYAATWGILPGQGLLQAYRRFLESPAEVRVVMYTDTIGDLATLAQYRKTDLPALLNMQVYVNGEAVDDLSFSEPAIRPAKRRLRARGAVLRRPRPSIMPFAPRSSRSMSGATCAFTPSEVLCVRDACQACATARSMPSLGSTGARWRSSFRSTRQSVSRSTTPRQTKQGASRDLDFHHKGTKLTKREEGLTAEDAEGCGRWVSRHGPMQPPAHGCPFSPQRHKGHKAGRRFNRRERRGTWPLGYHAWTYAASGL